MSRATRATRARLASLVLAASLVGLACATTGESGHGDANLPSAGVGPFRKLVDDEVKGIAPFVLDDSRALYREPAAIVEDGVVFLFAVARRDGRDVIVRTRASDGRSFYGTSADFGRSPREILAGGAAWEGASIGGPAVVRRGPELFLYYAAAGGIGVARAVDGVTFTKAGAPALAPDPSARWEATVPRAPSVYVAANGKFRMLYAAGVAIGEAESEDGVHFTRLGREPVLVPSAEPAPGSLLPNEKPPFDRAAVGDPCAVPRVTPAGRFHLRVLYTGTDPSGATTIGFAGRYDESGPLVRQPLPVYAVNAKEAGPAFVETGEGTFLYVQQERRASGSGDPYLAIAAGFGPANVDLGPAAEFPSEP